MKHEYRQSKVSKAVPCPPSSSSRSKKQHKDPVTGDPLTQGEYISWRVQGIIRRWTFLGIITVVTIIAWATTNGVVLTWWNLSASYLALVIESVVGIAMFSQTRRDAVVLREVRAISQRVEQLVAREEKEIERLTETE